MVTPKLCGQIPQMADALRQLRGHRCLIRGCCLDRFDDLMQRQLAALHLLPHGGERGQSDRRGVERPSGAPFPLLDALPEGSFFFPAE